MVQGKSYEITGVILMVNKKARMTNKERIHALLQRQKPDRVPIWPLALGFNTIYIGKTIADAYINPAAHLEGLRKTSADFDWVFYLQGANFTTLASEFGGEIKFPDSDYAQAPMITRFPVETVDDVFNLQIPDVKTAGTVIKRMEFCNLTVQEKNDNCLFNVMLWQGGPFTGIGNMAGIEKVSKWMLKKPEAVHRLMRLATDYYIQLSGYWKDTFGIEAVLPYYAEPTTSNQIISPAQFEHFVFPYIVELSENLLAMGYRHIYAHVCGEQNANLPFWSKIPYGNPGIVSIGHEVEFASAAKYFPEEIIMGNLEPAIIQTGTPDEIYKATAEVIKKGKEMAASGFIFSPGCELPPMSPPENVKAITQAVNDFGWYD
jgi:uroporphyrinogen decarboxylase